MNSKVTLFVLVVCLFQIFESVSTSNQVVPENDPSKKHSFSIGGMFRNIGNKWKKAKKKSAEQKFLNQVQHQKRLEEAARSKYEKRKNAYETSSRTTFSDLMVPEKWGLKKGYHYQLWRRVSSAKSDLRKLKNKHKREEFCEFDKKKKKWRLRKKKEVSDACVAAFKNSYFKSAKLTYNGESPYACQDGKVFVDIAGMPEPWTYPTKFKTCVATKEENGSKSKVNVYIKKSDKQKKGGKLKFFVFFAEENRADGDMMQKIKDWFQFEREAYKVAAYLKNTWF